MTHVTVSSKYQVVIPKEVRQQVPLRTGQKLAVVVKEGIISLLPDRPLASYRGFLKGLKVGVIREKRERL
jgi:AbrB family looped-hinge helix DNA binding protein